MALGVPLGSHESSGKIYKILLDVLALWKFEVWKKTSTLAAFGTKIYIPADPFFWLTVLEAFLVIFSYDKYSHR